MVEGKAIVVTGAGRGIGRAYAEALGAAGALVVVNNRTAARSDEVVAAIVGKGGRAVADGNDISTPDGARAAIDRCIGEFGRIDVLVNNAGGAIEKPAVETTLDEFDETLAINLRGTWLCGVQAMRHMIEQRSGTIINTASAAAFGMANRAPYAAAKGAIISLTSSWALELAQYGVTVNCISPRGLTGTAAQAAGARASWFGKAEDNAQLILYLASDDARWVSGQAIGVHRNRIYLVDRDNSASMFRADGWTPEAIREVFPVALGPYLKPCGPPWGKRGGYPWYDGVGTPDSQD